MGIDVFVTPGNDITLKNETYTIGKLIEYVLHYEYLLNKICTRVNFKVSSMTKSNESNSYLYYVIIVGGGDDDQIPCYLSINLI